MIRENEGADLRTVILDEAAKQFSTKGIKFTMDDLARSLGMSKKTIYSVFKDKRSIMIDTIDRFFGDAMAAEDQILNDPSLSVAEKLRRVIGQVPERYLGIELSQLYVLKEKYPAVYRHWHQWRERYWIGAEGLLEQGINEGSIRPVSLPVFKIMFQSTIEQFFQNDILVKNKIAYRDALAEVAEIMVNGIVIR